MSTSQQVPTCAEWLALPDSERVRIQASWNAYEGDGEDIVAKIVPT